MIPIRAPLIAPGQLYLHGELNEYLIVTKNIRGQVHYAGVGFNGQFEDQSFIERFQPVNPIDVSTQDIQDLLDLCPKGMKVSTGFIVD